MVIVGEGVEIAGARNESVLDGPRYGNSQRCGSGGHVLLDGTEHEREEHSHAQFACGIPYNFCCM
jgi:hypothetical protein